MRQVQLVDGSFVNADHPDFAGVVPRTHQDFVRALNGRAFADNQFPHLFPLLQKFRPLQAVSNLNWLNSVNVQEGEIVRWFCESACDSACGELPLKDREMHAIQKEQLLLVWKLAELTMSLIKDIISPDLIGQEMTIKEMRGFLKDVSFLRGLDEVVRMNVADAINQMELRLGQ